MNCPSRTEEPEGTGFNQNPNALAADLTTREDLNGIANARVLRRIASSEAAETIPDDDVGRNKEEPKKARLALEPQEIQSPRGAGEI